MEWGKLYANLPDDPRVQAAEDDGGAFGLLTESMCYCTGAETGGFIPDSQLRRFLCSEPDRVKALAREGLWIRDEERRGYVLDPHIWTEERNLSDSAEKKRRADRERVAAKRAAIKATPDGQVSRDMSRDSDATKPATSRSDSRALEKRRAEKNLPPTPRADMRPLWPSAVADARPEEEGDSGQDEKPGTDAPDAAALIAEIRSIRPGWSTRSVRRSLEDPAVAERPWPLVHAAALAVARDPDSQQPGRLAHDGPWWAQAAAEHRKPQTASRPPWCGKCSDDLKRQRERDDSTVERCPECHPLAVKARSA